MGQIHHDSHTECKHYSTSRVQKHGTQVDLLRFSRNQSCSTLVNTVPGTPKTVSVRRRQGREHVRKRVCLSAMSEPVKTEKLFSFMTTLETFTLLQKCYMRSSITWGFRHSPSVLEQNRPQKRVFREKLALDTLSGHKQHQPRLHGLDIRYGEFPSKVGDLVKNQRFKLRS